MVIERALEKLRQQTGSRGEPPQLQTFETERRRTARPAAGARPVLPVLNVDAELAQRRRILLPGGQLPNEARANASYRMLRTRMLHRMQSHHWQTLAITSPGAGEGKSLTAVNLALSMARDKSVDVFLIDLDLRNPSLCPYMGVRPPCELARYFAGEGAPGETLFSIGIENLALAGSTVPSEQASELLASARLEELFNSIRGIAVNPVILLDLPPLLVTDEALLVAPRVDATLLVVAEGRTRRDSLARARQLLAEFSFAGAILNHSLESFGSDSYYGYGYRYGQVKN